MQGHALPIEEALRQLDTHPQNGLTGQEARARFERHGPNELQEKPRPGFLRLLLSQFDNFLIIILIVAAVVSLLLGEWVDAIAILAIVVLNAVLGVVQESKAEQALAALKKMAAPSARVIRDGQQFAIPARELVPGDVVLVEAGNYVPADLRLVESVNLKAEEASLTGESVPVNKDARAVLEPDAALGDRRNAAFMSTLVTYGRGKGIVTATGMGTQIGQIAEMLQTAEDEQTPLQKKLAQLGKTLGILSLAICGLIFVYGVIRDTSLGMLFQEGIRAYLAAHQHDLVSLFMTAVSLAIAAVPEGLPAVVTICLALGMQRMVSRHALIRKLPAVETLGSATVICSDKTGTLTQNEMTVVAGWAGGHDFRVTGEGYQPQGHFYRGETQVSTAADPACSLLLVAGVLCNDARLEPVEDEDGTRTWRMVGDPTEGALVVAGAKAGRWREDLEIELPRVAEIPFDSERKCMTTIHEAGHLGTRIAELWEDRAAAGNGDEPYLAFVKGAPDIVLEYCDQIVLHGQIAPLIGELRETILAANTRMATQALRVLGLACRPLAELPEEPQPDAVERNLIFLGLLGMIDPARPEVKVAVDVANRAGLKSIMITGDYRDTAQAIADQIGMLTNGGRVVTGADIDAMSDDELDGLVERLDVCARSSPQHKMRIVDALMRREHVVAMTGDGVNDAPALKRANIGVAMGITGTDVTKETADMVLTDDNYASIVSAIEEGRVIYSNIRKFVFYLISCNIGEILIIFVSMLAGLPIPLRPIQLLWLNLVTDGAPALALGLEKGDPDIMNRPPRPVREPVINREMLAGVIVQAVVMTVAVLAAYLIAGAFPGAGAEHEGIGRWQTVAFTTLVASELLRAFTARSERYSVFGIGFFGNRTMLYAVGASFVLMLLVIYVPFLQGVFNTVGLTWRDWLMMAPFMLLASIAAEVTKVFLRRRAERAAPIKA